MAELRWKENIVSQLQNVEKTEGEWISAPLYFADLSGNATLLTAENYECNYSRLLLSS